jgi:PAS domain S-box-containing protein
VGGLYGIDEVLKPLVGIARMWATAGTVAIAYFLAAHLGLALQTEPSGVAVFWPASGIAAGMLIVFGPRIRPALVLGVVVGTIVANLMSDRGLWTSVFDGFCNAGEAVLAAWLLDKWFDRPFTFGDLRHVAGFTAAAAIGVAASSLGGAATMTLLHTTAPFWQVWREWFLSDGLGVLAVAPLIIVLAQSWHDLPSRAESIEGVGMLSVLTLLSSSAVTQPSGSWLTFDPDVAVLLPLLWLAARCQPTFGIAGAFIASFIVIWATTFGVGHFGESGVPLIERVNGARAVVAEVTLFTLVLTALFAERRRNEAALRIALHAEEATKTRLADAMVAGQVMAFEWNATTGLAQRENAARILGLERTSSGEDFFSRIHVEDRARLEEKIGALRPSNDSYALTFRFIRPDGRQVWLEETGQGEFDEAGRLLRIRGLTRDITERKQAEEHQNVLNAELDHRVKNVLATVNAIILQTQTTNASIGDFVTSFERRIRSLATTHDLLSQSRWRGAPLLELIRREFTPYTARNTDIGGPSITLQPAAAQATGMVLHELATNAAKYGAFSNHTGRISVRWFWLPNSGPDDRLAIEWQEIDGPAVSTPGASGYGSSIIRELLPYELGGTVDLTFAPGGVRCRLEVPGLWINSDAI